MSATTEPRSYGDSKVRIEVTVSVAAGAPETWYTEARFDAGDPPEAIAAAIDKAFSDIHQKVRELVR